MLVADFDYELPQELIAQEPAARRDEARLLVVHRKERRIEDRNFRDIKAYLGSTDLLVLNDTKVIPARLFGTTHGGRRIELLLLREVEPGVWDALSRPSRRAKPGVCLDFGEAYAEVLDWGKAGVRRVRFSDADVLSLLLRK
ncbi:MAG: S-adenosylmethionine:tRNA ribosyltransferase-isomerase, partial [candidate division WOR-3 bacterium]